MQVQLPPASPIRLEAEFDCAAGELVALVGHEQVAKWIEQVDSGDWAQLVESLLALHYDPSYLRSIDRNFPQRVHGQVIRLEGHLQMHYDAAASSLSL